MGVKKPRLSEKKEEGKMCYLYRRTGQMASSPSAYASLDDIRYLVLVCTQQRQEKFFSWYALGNGLSAATIHKKKKKGGRQGGGVKGPDNMPLT